MTETQPSTANTKAKMTLVLRKLARSLATLLISILCIGVPIALIASIYETFTIANADMDAVEPYCLARYNHDVTAYKACTKMKAHEVLKDLTNEINQLNDKEAKK